MQQYARSAITWPGNTPYPLSCAPPRTNIVFLKTHKCASSTVMNILLRFGSAHNLNFVLPKSKKTHYLGHPQPFNRKLVADLPPCNMTYNILTHHTRFNFEEMRQLMPHDTLYITILRRPDSLFESLYSYCNFSSIFKRNLTAFVRDTNLTAYLSGHRLVKESVGLNQMSFDLGYDGLYDSEAAVDKFVLGIDTTFDLVMLFERLDESLVLLKHLLCWNTTDMVALKVNSRYSAYKEVLSDDTKKRLLQLNSVDWKLYKHFAKVFDDRVKAFGEDRMAQEVAMLRAAQREYYDRCVMAEEPMENVSTIKKRKDVVAFKSNNTSKLCRRLTWTELEFHEQVKKTQEKRMRKCLARHMKARSRKHTAPGAGKGSSKSKAAKSSTLRRRRTKNGV
ncbi:galactose-3-O-sulfotransferase 2-like [Haemaphysalis longicornis]